MERFVPLSPTAFLRRSSQVFAQRVAVIDGDWSCTYAELGQRARRLGGALAAELPAGERVAVLAPNTHVALESTLGIPAGGHVLVALNIRLSPQELAYIIGHSGARWLIYDHEWEDTAKMVQAGVPQELRTIRAGGPGDEYEGWLRAAEPADVPVSDEAGLLALNYTSGTTGRPKGAMYHHRGAYLQALSMAIHARLDPGSVYLWTLPMFHCNGWCFPWAVTAVGATHVCLRRPEPSAVWSLVRRHGVTHCCAAPTVLNSLLHDEAAADGPPPSPPVRVSTGGSPPSPTLLRQAADVGLAIQHLYGLTESFGPSVVCDWWPEWDDLPHEEAARRKAMQGVGTVVTSAIRVMGDDGAPVPADGRTPGELQVKGDNTMLGYYGDAEATSAAFDAGWLRTGDIVVQHPDGYVEVRDRSKDVIISGGENISSVEVEQALASHPSVFECAVVGVPHDHWGEVPHAFVTLRAGAEVTVDALRDHVRGRLASFKVPKHVTFVEELPKTATGKIQKFRLRSPGGDAP